MYSLLKKASLSVHVINELLYDAFFLFYLFLKFLGNALKNWIKFFKCIRHGILQQGKKNLNLQKAGNGYKILDQNLAKP